MHLKTSSGKCEASCLGLIALNDLTSAGIEMSKLCPVYPVYVQAVDLNGYIYVVF